MTTETAMGSGRGRALPRVASLILALLLAFAGLARLQPYPVLAGDDFCAGDPILSLDGELVRLTIQMPVASLGFISASNPVRIVVEVPRAMTAQVVAYSGTVPEQVEFVEVEPTARTGEAMISFAIYAPEQSESTRYPVYHTATSRLETTHGQGMSGELHGNTIRVPQHDRAGKYGNQRHEGQAGQIVDQLASYIVVDQSLQPDLDVDQDQSDQIVDQDQPDQVVGQDQPDLDVDQDQSDQIVDQDQPDQVLDQDVPDQTVEQDQPDQTVEQDQPDQGVAQGEG